MHGERDAETVGVPDRDDEMELERDCDGVAVVLTDTTALAVGDTEVELLLDALRLDEAAVEAVRLALTLRLALTVALTLPLRLTVALALGLAVGEALTVALTLSVALVEGLWLVEIDTVASTVGDIDTVAGGVPDVEVEAVGETVSDGACELDTEGELSTVAVTDAVGVGVPLQMHCPSAGAPQERKQQRLTQDEMEGVTVGDSRVVVTDGVMLLLAVELDVWLLLGDVLGVMHVHLYGGTVRQLEVGWRRKRAAMLGS
jgi:hypothetical protein